MGAFFSAVFWLVFFVLDYVALFLQVYITALGYRGTATPPTVSYRTRVLWHGDSSHRFVPH